MIRIPVPKTWKDSLMALWLNAAEGTGSVYNHLLWDGNMLYSFNEGRGVFIKWKLYRPSVFADLLGDKVVKLDYNTSTNELIEAEDPRLFDLVYASVVTDGGEELERYVIEQTVSESDARHAIRELTVGRVSMKQLSALKRIQALVVINKMEGVELIAERINISIRHRSVRKPRVTVGYVKYLSDYPEDGIVFIEGIDSDMDSANELGSGLDLCNRDDIGE